MSAWPIWWRPTPTYPLGTTDAAVVAVAERLGITEIATLDRRHFHAVRPRHADGFTIVP